MQYFAYPVNGLVREVVQIPDGAKLSDCFQPTFAAALVPCSANVQQGWTYANSAFTAPGPAVPSAAQNQAQARMLLDAADVTMARVLEGVITGTCAFANADVIAFAQYRASLRPIAATGTVPAAGWPSRPAYPSGT